MSHIVCDSRFITSRGYRAAKSRPLSDRALKDEALFEIIVQIHAENYGVYGVRKMWHAMRRAGWDVGRDQVARLMGKVSDCLCKGWCPTRKQ